MNNNIHAWSAELQHCVTSWKIYIPVFIAKFEPWHIICLAMIIRLIWGPRWLVCIIDIDSVYAIVTILYLSLGVLNLSSVIYRLFHILQENTAELGGEAGRWRDQMQRIPMSNATEWSPESHHLTSHYFFIPHINWKIVCKSHSFSVPHRLNTFRDTFQHNKIACRARRLWNSLCGLPHVSS